MRTARGDDSYTIWLSSWSKQLGEDLQIRSGKSVRFLFLSVFFLAFGHCAFPQSGVGTLDHVRIIVRDIQATRSSYLNQLGFASPVKEPFVYPEGSAHDGAQLADGQWIEWIGVVDQEKLSKARPWMANFIAKYEGAHSVGIMVSSAADTATHLKSAGIEFSEFSLIRKEGQQPVQLVTPKMAHMPEGSIFFVQYPPRKTPLTRVTQPNTADRIDAVWIVVKNLKAASADLTALGFRRVRHLRSKMLGAEGQVFAGDHGNLVLLHASKADGPVSQFAAERGDGVMGLTVLVKNLEQAHTLAESNTGRTFPIYKGWEGQSFLIPAQIASGAWIEMAHGK